jgi:hypothetical protein
MTGMKYEELETELLPGDTVIFYSDGLVEAHDPQRQMFGFPRLRDLLAAHRSEDAGEVVDFLLGQLAEFTGPRGEQEDDITLVTLHRATNVASLTSFAEDMQAEDGSWRTVADFSVPSVAGNERMAMQRVRDALDPLGMCDAPIELESETPDLEMKLASMQTPRGWGLFLIKNMVDETEVYNDDDRHTLRLVVHRKGADHDG